MRKVYIIMTSAWSEESAICYNTFEAYSMKTKRCLGEGCLDDLVNKYRKNKKVTLYARTLTSNFSFKFTKIKRSVTDYGELRGMFGD